MGKLKKCLRSTDFKSQKVIDDFKRYVESFYLDFINEEMIDEYILVTRKTDKEKQILIKRFLWNEL